MKIDSEWLISFFFLVNWTSIPTLKDCSIIGNSIYTDSELDSSFIDSKTLGKLKLEHVCKRAIFLTPKVYCLETIEGEFIYKIKGLKKDTDLSFQDFEKLLIKNSLIKKKKSKQMI